MKSFFVFLTLVFWCSMNVNVTAQEDIVIEPRNLVRTDDGSFVKGTFLRSNKGIRMISKDSIYLYYKLSDNKFRIFDLKTLDFLATTPKAESVRAFEEGFFLDKMLSNRKEFYDWEGQLLWTKNATTIFCDYINKVFVCLNSPSQNGPLEGDFVAYDLLTGEELWKHVIPQEYHFCWHDLYRRGENKDNYYLIGDRLNCLNIKTGEMVSRSFTVTVNESAKSAFPSLTNEVYASVEWRKDSKSVLATKGRIGGLHSNWIQSGDSLFVADANYLYCFGQKLNLIWAAPLPENCGSKSHLGFDNDRLLFLNFGVGFQYKSVSSCALAGRYGKPFMATFDKKSGKQLSYYEPSLKYRLRGGKFVSGRVYWFDADNFYFTNEGENSTIQMKWEPKSAFEPDRTVPRYDICNEIGVIKDGMLDMIKTNEHQVVVELSGKDVNVICDNDSMRYLRHDQVFFHDENELYSTNAEEERHYLIVDSVSHKILFSFWVDGVVSQEKNGDIWIFMKDGVGVIRKEQYQALMK